MSEAREAVLARIRAANATAEARPPAAAAQRVPGVRLDDPVARFAERAADYRATVRRCALGEVAAVVAAALAEHGAARVGVPPGLDAGWRPEGVELVEDDGMAARDLDGLDGAVTGCALAIAETGTIVLDGGARSGRRALSLVPDLHVCVVAAADVVPDVDEAMAALRDRATRPLTFVSGPSATSDIELNRVEGVHGPRRLEVVLAG